MGVRGRDEKERESGKEIARVERKGESYVKSPVASLCLVCSSVRKRVRVTMSVLIFSWPTGPPSPLDVPFVEDMLVSGRGAFMVAI